MKFRLSGLCAALAACAFLPALAGGRTFYVDAERGDDANPGTSESAPWKGTDRVEATQLGPGDRVLFRAGRVWRLGKQLSLHAHGTEAEPVVVSSYGDGAKPEFRGSLDGTAAGFWTASSNGLWTASVSGKTDVGNIVLVRRDDPSGRKDVGWKKWSLDDVREEGDFFHDRAAGIVWFKCARNPGDAYALMEVCRRINLIGVGRTAWLQVKGLALTYTGAHGIVGAPVQHLRVNGCEFGWIGGSWLGDWPDGHGGTYPVRYGNGIEFWATGENRDIRLENNYFYEVYDTAMTNQGNDEGVLDGMVICSNRTVNCEQSYEVWFTHTNYFVKSVEVFGNRFEDAGFGWSHAQRPNQNATHFLSYGFKCRVGEMNYHDNYLGRTKQCMFWWFSWPAIEHIKLDRNTYCQPGIDPATWRGLFMWQKEKGGWGNPAWEDYRRLTGNDAHSVLQTPEETDPAQRAYLASQTGRWLALPNGDFEELQRGNYAAFAGWSVTDRPKDLKSVAVADGEVRHGGAHALRVEARAGEKIQVARNVNLGDAVFVPGGTYRIRAWLRAPEGARTGAASFHFGVFAKGLKCLYSKGFDYPAAGGVWQEVSDTFTLPAGGEMIRLMFNFRDGAVGWVDDVVLEERLPDGSFRIVHTKGF